MFKKDTYIVVSLGDDGAIVSCFKDLKLFRRIFVTSPVSSDFTDLAKEFTNAPIYILLDTIDQNYVFSSIPSVGKSNVGKIVKRKMQTEFDQNDINASLYLAKEQVANKKTLKYVFISLRNSSPLKEWLDVVNDLPNKFEGIYLIPIEAEDYIKRIRQATHGETKTADEWEVLISYNRVGGFRQIVLRKGKLIFTRISQSISMQTPDAVGKNISQEAANTLEYIRRIGFYDQTISMYIICSKEANNFIEIPGIKPKDIYVYSPYDLSQKLDISHASQENDKFGDVIFAANFIRAKKILRLGTAATKESAKLTNISKLITYISYFLMGILPLCTIYFLYSAISTSGEINDFEVQLNQKNKELAGVKNFEKEYGIKPEILIEAVKTKNTQIAKDAEFFEIMRRYKAADTYSTYIEFLSYDKDKGDKMQLELRVTFDYAGIKSYSDVLYMLEKYTTDVKKAMEGYQVFFNNLPSEKDIKVDFATSDTKMNKTTVTVRIMKGR